MTADNSIEAVVDLGKESALLHTYLVEVLPQLPPAMQHEFAQLRDHIDTLDDYHEMNDAQVQAKLTRLRQVRPAPVHHKSTSSYENNVITPTEKESPRYAVVASIDDDSPPLVALKPKRRVERGRRDVSAGDAVRGIVSLDFMDKSVENEPKKTQTNTVSSGYQSSQSPPSSSSASPTNRNAAHMTPSSTNGHGSDGEREALYATVPLLTTETILDAREPVTPVLHHVMRAKPFFVPTEHSTLKSTVSSTSSNGSACSTGSSRPRRPRTNPKYGAEFTRATSLSLTPNHTRSDESAEESTSTTTGSDWTQMQPFMDRLRRLEMELEAEKETNRSIVTEQQRQIDQLRNDNQALKQVGMTQSLYAIADHVHKPLHHANSNAILLDTSDL